MTEDQYNQMKMCAKTKKTGENTVFGILTIGLLSFDIAIDDIGDQNKYHIFANGFMLPENQDMDDFDKITFSIDDDFGSVQLCSFCKTFDNWKQNTLKRIYKFIESHEDRERLIFKMACN